MSGSHLAVIIIPIVTAIALFAWLAAVLWASTHPRYKRSGSAPRTEVAGGAFRAVDGGRQLMPIPEHRPAGVPAPRAAEGETATTSAQTAAVPGQRQPGAQPEYAASGSQQTSDVARESQLAGVAGQRHGLERGASAVLRRDQDLDIDEPCGPLPADRPEIGLNIAFPIPSTPPGALPRTYLGFQ